MIFTTDASPMARLLLNMMGAFAEFERSLIRQRTGEGMARAKAEGRSGGRPSKLTLQQRAHAIEQLKADIRIRHFSNGKQLIEALSDPMEELPDLVLLDLSLPDSFGLETLENANEVAPEIPIIVLTGRNDEDFAADVIRTDGGQGNLSSAPDN